MIGVEEIKHQSVELGVPIQQIEKDYVMGWLLWGIYNYHSLSNRLILKGGNALRKVYFTDTRFSDDLDFTTYSIQSEGDFRSNLNDVCQLVKKASGIEFKTDKTIVETKQTPDTDCKALDGRVYFPGFAGDDSVTMRIKFDISEYEKIVLPLQRHPIIHNYQDADVCRVDVTTYSLEEILAEKLRSWIQRTRSRDLFDVVKIVQSNIIPIVKRNILSAFFQKTIFKQIPLAGKEELLYEDKFNIVERDWLKTIICPSNSIIVFKNAVSLFKDFVLALFDSRLLEEVGVPVISRMIYPYNIGGGLREVLTEAGKLRKIVRMTYHGLSRDIEPYSFRYRRGKELFYGFDRTKDQTIKSFNLGEIQGVSILPQTFFPRWVVEF